MKQLLKFRGQLFFTLVLLVMILAAPFTDYVERNFTCEEMNYPEDVIGIVTVENETLTIPGGAGSVPLTSDGHYLKKGTYHLTFAVTADADGSTVQVYDPLYLNSDNTSGRVLNEAPVEPGQEEVTLSFTLDGSLTCVQFRVLGRKSPYLPGHLSALRAGHLPGSADSGCAYTAGLLPASAVPNPSEHPAGDPDYAGFCLCLVFHAADSALAFKRP